MSKIDPELKKKLLKESQAPFKGLRRLLWIAFTGSAFLGLFIMLSKISSGTEAVSYTHLRAHETPEHLVCRLLLEKKKLPN